jgi:hypothetical protein
LFAVVLALLCVNALAVWGQQAAQVVFTTLQATIGLAAIVCAFVVARRKHGLERSWRLAVIAAFVASLVGDLLWYAGRTTVDGTAPPIGVATYFLPPLLTLVITLRWKISAHMVGIGGLLGALLGVMVVHGAHAPVVLALAFVAAGALGTARLLVSDHTPAQVYVGTLLGTACMLGCILLGIAP